MRVMSANPPKFLRVLGEYMEIDSANQRNQTFTFTLEATDGYNKVTATYTVTIIYNEKLVLVPKPGSTITIIEGNYKTITAVDPMGKSFKFEFQITYFSPIMPLCTILSGKTILMKPFQKTNITFGVFVRADNGKKITTGFYKVIIIYKKITINAIFD